jgi:hypothetical protein
MFNEKKKQTFQVFCSYSHKDRAFQDDLVQHLAALKRIGMIELWYDQEICAGDDWKKEISENLERADIVLLLVSANFIASDYCYTIEMKRALELHESKQAVAIPIIIRTCDWGVIPSLSKLQALPSSAKAVDSWPNPDEAWADVSKGIRKTIDKIKNESISIKTIKKGKIEVFRSVEELNTRSVPPDCDHLRYLLLSFLRTWGKWYFNAARIRGWGARQPGYEEFAEYDTTTLGTTLKKLEKAGILTSRTSSESGTLLFKYK